MHLIPSSNFTIMHWKICAKNSLQKKESGIHIAKHYIGQLDGWLSRNKLDNKSKEVEKELKQMVVSKQTISDYMTCQKWPIIFTSQHKSQASFNKFAANHAILDYITFQILWFHWSAESILNPYRIPLRLFTILPGLCTLPHGLICLPDLLCLNLYIRIEIQ